MRGNSSSSSRCQIAVAGLRFGLALLAWHPASGQNFLKNPDFEEPLGPDNWTVEYAAVLNSAVAHPPTASGPGDFMIKGRTRLGHKDKAPGTWDGAPNYWNKFGAHFKGSHDWLMHAYFKQTVSGLMPGSNYTVSCWMTQFEGLVDKVQVYLEAMGGPNGAVSKQSPYVTTTVLGSPQNWTRYAVTNTASNSGQIEVRLHFNKNVGTSGEKWRNIDALYDHAAVMLTEQPAPYLPPCKILSLTLTNQDVTLRWETVMNNSYRIQFSSAPANPMSWSTFNRDPFQDPDLLASGTSLTFSTNLFSNDPSYNLDVPLFFRIFSQGYRP